MTPTTTKRDEQGHVRRQEIAGLVGGGRTRHHAGVPRDGHGDAFAEVQRPRGFDGQRRPGLRDGGRRLLRAVASREGVGPDSGDVRRQVNHGPRPLDWHIPLVAGDVPVELVVLVEELQPVAHAVAHHGGLHRVLRAGDPDLQLPVVPLAARFVPKRRPGPVRDRLDVQAEVVGEALGRPVFDRDRAIEAVPRPGEARPDRLGDGDDPVAADARRRRRTAGSPACAAPRRRPATRAGRG